MPQFYQLYWKSKCSFIHFLESFSKNEHYLHDSFLQLLLLTHLQSFAHFINSFFPLQLVYFFKFLQFSVFKAEINSCFLLPEELLHEFHSICSEVPTSALFQCLLAWDSFHYPLIQNYNFFCFTNLINYSFPVVHLMHFYFFFQTF